VSLKSDKNNGCFALRPIYIFFIRPSYGPGSSVGIATDYGLDGPGSNPGGDEIFRPSRPALGAHPASYTMGTRSFPGVEAAGAWG